MRRELRQRWFGVGSSDGADSRDAGAAAADAAMEGAEPKLIVVFSSHDYDLDALLDGVKSVAGDAPLIGCTTAGEISADRVGDSSVVVAALGGDGFSIATAAADKSSEGLRAAGAEVARCASEVEERPHRALLLLTDGLAGDQQEIVRGAYSVVGAGVPMVGGCAGDGMRMIETFQMHEGQRMTNAVVGATIASDAPLGVGVHHGWSRVGTPMLVSSSNAGEVLELDNRPALDVYLERHAVPAGAREDPAAFTHFAQTRPLGLGGRRNEDAIRFVTGADFERRSVRCIAEVPQGGIAWFMQGDAASVMDATDRACEQALEGIGGHDPLGLMVFDCIARRAILGDEGITEEVGRIARYADGAPVAGFYTYGEIARNKGVSGFHNQTLVALAVG